MEGWWEGLRGLRLEQPLLDRRVREGMVTMELTTWMGVMMNLQPWWSETAPLEPWDEGLGSWSTKLTRRW